MRDIFISYRRDDSKDPVRALYQSLVPLYGEDRVFMDVDSIAPGSDFRKEIERWLSRCGVFLVVIGPKWLTLKGANDDSGPRRLEIRNDLHRQEVATALMKGDSLPVIPVLVDGATMPTEQQLPDDLKDLAFRNALALSHEDWGANLQKLVNTVRPYVGEPKNASVDRIEPSKPRDPILDRLEDQINWYDIKSTRLQKTYQRAKIIAFMSACLIPFLAALQMAMPSTADPITGVAQTRITLGTTIALLGILIAMLEGVLLMGQHQQKWVTYRSTCEALRREKSLYMAGAGVYAAAANPRILLAERMETISSQEKTSWVSMQQPR